MMGARWRRKNVQSTLCALSGHHHRTRHRGVRKGMRALRYWYAVAVHTTRGSWMAAPEANASKPRSVETTDVR